MEIETQIHMVSAADQVFAYKKKDPTAIPEDVFQQVSNHINEKRIKDDRIKMAMIMAANKAFEIATKNPRASEKVLFNEFIKEIPNLLAKIE